MSQRIYIKNLRQHTGQQVTIAGWVHIRRDQGKMIFLEMRDATGFIQGVILPGASEAIQTAKEVRPEWVLRLSGQVNKRPEKNINPEADNGDIELEIQKVEVLNQADTPPFEITEDTGAVKEETRMKHRYLDLRTQRMAENIRMRDQVIRFFREFFHRHDFVEIETPLMIKDTPEGSREYVVPSRQEPGRFYALPQSPQQLKQLCMTAGFERYFQIARCMRDEDTRGDRQPEFTQLDYEMSFVEQEDILQLTETMFLEMVETLYPNKKLTFKPFHRMTYQEAMDKYQSDKPDLRENPDDPDELAFAWIVDFPMFEQNDDGEIEAAHHPFCSVRPEDKEKFMAGKDLFSIRANSYDLILNGYELSSGSIRIHDQAEQRQVFNLLGISPEEQEVRFGHMLEAFRYGTPPHGGFAPGIDRIMMILQNEPSIREVIAFPKTGEGRDLLLNAPSELNAERLKELGLKVSRD